MPKVKTNRVKYPEGWELIEPTLRELQAKMREGFGSFYTNLTRVFPFTDSSFPNFVCVACRGWFFPWKQYFCIYS